MACSSSNEVERTIDASLISQGELYVTPAWVMRLNLDERPRMIGLALNKDLYAAYDAQLAALYKVWKGDIWFTGPVYDNIHGNQPVSRGEAYIQDTVGMNPWFISVGGKTEAITADYRGYLRGKQTVSLKYHILLPSGETVQVEEKPEFVRSKDGRPGFERMFTISSLPKGTDLLLAISVEHLNSESDIETDGSWVDPSFEERSFDWGSSKKYTGRLKLKANGTTVLRTYFEPKATAHVALTQEEEEEQDEEEISESTNETLSEIEILALKGKHIIGKNDCAACHSVDKAIIGPSYQMVAQKYESDMATIDQLSQKIIQGGSGVWGERPMSPHPLVQVDEAKAMAAYILSVVSDDEVERKAGVAADFYDIRQPLPSLPELVAGQNPNASDVYPNIDFRSGNPDLGMNTDEQFSDFSTDFVMAVNCYLNVPESKTYDLQFVANNGGRLFVDGKLITEGHYYEGTFIDQAELYLTKGAHKIHIDFYHHLFDKYLILMWRENKSDEYEPIPAEFFTYNPFDLKPTSSGIKQIVQSNAPGFGASLEKIHPAFDLSTVRPEGFEPRVGDLEFMQDGRLALCTWDGEVYILENVSQDNSEQVQVSKFADGLSEPLGITIVDGEIYVLQRWEITKLVDHDKDGVADEYESIADSWGSSAHFHEWTYGLLYRDGSFHFNTGIAMGHNAHNQPLDRGKSIQVAMDGSYKHLAYGLKETNGIGFGIDGEIFAAENEGEFIPVCKILHIPKEGKPFYGNKSVDKDNLPERIKPEPPVIWLPQNEIGNSPSQPIMMHHGPYEGQMIHGEITHGGIKRDFIEKVKGQYQGAVFRFTQGLEVGINRMEWGPDGALYAAGLGGSQDFGHKGHQFGIQRLTYNGHPPFEMLAIRAKANGLEVEFTKPLRIGDGTDPSDYKVQQWYFVWTEEIDSQEKRELENLNIRSVSLNEDRTKAFLELDGMKQEHVLYVQLQPSFLSEDNEQLWSNEGWYTLNKFPDEVGVVNPHPHPSQMNALSAIEADAGWELLFDGRTTKGWIPIDQNTNWSVSDGQLQGKGESSLLATSRSYANFELELEWKVESGAEGGILFHMPDGSDTKTALSVSPRMQLVDDQGNEDAKAVREHQSGANYDISEPEYVVSNPANEYNHARMLVQGTHVEHWINGIKVSDYELGNDTWQNNIQGSIYANVPDYGKATEGLIALYAQQGNIWLRNVRIKSLDGI
ncbi:MAG: family 16 glycoside hydrolase [Bacteroidota bacterium]